MNAGMGPLAHGMSATPTPWGCCPTWNTLRQGCSFWLLLAVSAMPNTMWKAGRLLTEVSALMRSRLLRTSISSLVLPMPAGAEGQCNTVVSAQVQCCFYGPTTPS